MTGRSRIDLLNVPSRSRSLPSQQYNVLCLIGPATWGPMNEATVVIDYPDFYEKFGGFMASYEAPLQAKIAFDSGVRRIMYTRVCHVTDHAASATPASAVKATRTFKTAVGGTYSDVNALVVNALYYGTRGNSLLVKIQDASNGVAGSFDLLVYEGTELLEWFRNLSMLDTDTRYAETIINTSTEHSKYITVTDSDAGDPAGTALDQRPVNVAAGALLTGGDDGLTALATTDYIGATTFTTGLYAFNLSQYGDKLACPDQANDTFQDAATSYCDTVKKGKMTFIVDPAASSDKAAIILQAQNLTASEYRTGVLWPKIKISNPSKTIYGQAPQITVMPSCAYCGRISVNSTTTPTKHFTQPSNEVYGLLDVAVDLESDYTLNENVRDYVTDYGVNCIVKGIRATDGNFGIWVDDCQLGKTSGNFKTVGEQFGVAYLRATFEAYLQRHRTQGNTPERRQTIKEAFETELLKWTGDGAFASKKASEAFYVNADIPGEGLNNPLVQDEQRMRILVGVATASAARFIELMFTKDSRAVESYIQQQLTATAQS